MARVPLGNAARAIRRVASGIGCSSSGRNDIRLLLPTLVGAREQLSRSADQAPAEFATSVTVGNGPVRRGVPATHTVELTLAARRPLPPSYGGQGQRSPEHPAGDPGHHPRRAAW